MTKFFRQFVRLNLLAFLITTLHFISVQAQESEPTEPDLPPELTKIELNETDSKELFDVLSKWNLVVTDRQTQEKKIQTSEVVCVENMEDGRQLGCTVYDDLRSHDVTKYNKNADPLFKVLVKHIPMECEDDSETCMLTAEKMACTLSANKYFCAMEVLVPQPQKKKGDSK